MPSRDRRLPPSDKARGTRLGEEGADADQHHADENGGEVWQDQKRQTESGHEQRRRHAQGACIGGKSHGGGRHALMAGERGKDGLRGEQIYNGEKAVSAMRMKRMELTLCSQTLRRLLGH